MKPNIIFIHQSDHLFDLLELQLFLTRHQKSLPSAQIILLTFLKEKPLQDDLKLDLKVIQLPSSPMKQNKILKKIIQDQSYIYLECSKYKKANCLALFLNQDKQFKVHFKAAHSNYIAAMTTFFSLNPQENSFLNASNIFAKSKQQWPVSKEKKQFVLLLGNQLMLYKNEIGQFLNHIQSRGFEVYVVFDDQDARFSQSMKHLKINKENRVSEQHQALRLISQAHIVCGFICPLLQVAAHFLRPLMILQDKFSSKHLWPQTCYEEGVFLQQQHSKNQWRLKDAFNQLLYRYSQNIKRSYNLQQQRHFYHQSLFLFLQKKSSGLPKNNANFMKQSNENNVLSVTPYALFKTLISEPQCQQARYIFLQGAFSFFDRIIMAIFAYLFQQKVTFLPPFEFKQVDSKTRYRVFRQALSNLIT